MTLYSTLCEVSGSLSPNGKTSENGNIGTNGNGYSRTYQAPYAWIAPKDATITEETKFTWFASQHNPQPYNPDDTGIAPRYKNEVEAAAEVEKQLPPSFTYEGPIGGAGPLGLFAPKPGSAEYEAYVLAQKAKEKYNAERVGVVPLTDNKITANDEIDKQSKGTHLYDGFIEGFTRGYTRAPEDENVFANSLDDARKSLTGIIDPSNYYLLAIVGGVFLLILILK